MDCKIWLEAAMRFLLRRLGVFRMGQRRALVRLGSQINHRSAIGTSGVEAPLTAQL